MNDPDKQNLRILVIDDTESIHGDFRKTLCADEEADDLAAQEADLFGPGRSGRRRRTPFVIDSAMQGQEGHAKVLEAIRAGKPYAMAFVDMRMPPGWDGVQTIEHLWQADPNLQVVICTAYSDYSWDQIIDRLGVNDRLLILRKPFDNSEVSQVALALTQKWHMTRRASIKLEELEQIVQHRTIELRHAATHDLLTGLGNRGMLTEQLRNVISGTGGWEFPVLPAMEGVPAIPGVPGIPGERDAGFALLFLDCDRFKIINDSLGHRVGDEVLKGIAQRMRRVVAGLGTEGPRWTAARLGGDEFVLLLHQNRGRTFALDVAQRLLEELRAPFAIDGYDVYATASIGMTTSDFDYARPEDALRDADAAMYRAKTSGKDRLAVFDRSMHEQTVTRLELETDLRKAQERSEFRLEYQPIVATDSGRIVGFEALLRWDNPRRGPVSPVDFIPLAEEIGLITSVGRWALQLAVEQLRLWHERFPSDPPLYMSVNLSKRQLLEPRLVNQVADLLAAARLPARALKLEVTESIIMDKPEAMAPILEQLRGLGVGLSMDDFGTGHSSLNCLHRFPIDVLKIDRAFIGNMDSNREYSAVVQAIVTLAANMGMKVTAEGIETREQLAQIQAIDCDSGQGWLFSKARPAEACTEMLAAGQPLGRG